MSCCLGIRSNWLMLGSPRANRFFNFVPEPMYWYPGQWNYMPFLPNHFCTSIAQPVWRRRRLAVFFFFIRGLAMTGRVLVPLYPFKKLSDCDMISTCNLLIWSQTRYHCAQSRSVGSFFNISGCPVYVWVSDQTQTSLRGVANSPLRSWAYVSLFSLLPGPQTCRTICWKISPSLQGLNAGCVSWSGRQKILVCVLSMDPGQVAIRPSSQMGSFCCCSNAWGEVEAWTVDTLRSRFPTDCKPQFEVCRLPFAVCLFVRLWFGSS